MHALSNLDIKKYSFCVRVVGICNSLPDSVVIASSVNSFKNKLDKFWSSEELLYDCDYDFSGNIS